MVSCTSAALKFERGCPIALISTMLVMWNVKGIECLSGGRFVDATLAPGAACLNACRAALPLVCRRWWRLVQRTSELGVMTATIEADRSLQHLPWDSWAAAPLASLRMHRKRYTAASLESGTRRPALTWAAFRNGSTVEAATSSKMCCICCRPQQHPSRGWY
jgi:hypothetical protein